MLIGSNDSMIVYWDAKGQVLSCGGHQAAVFGLLDKLGLQTVPTKNCTVWTTSFHLDPGTYITSYTVSGNVITCNVQVPTALSSITMDDFKIDEPVPEHKPTKDMRRQWRTNEKRHSRNTGRKIGRR